MKNSLQDESVSDVIVDYRTRVNARCDDEFTKALKAELIRRGIDPDSVL